MGALEKILEQEVIEQPLIAHRPIDLVHLSRQSLGDPGLESEILMMFDQMVHTHMSRIRETVDVEVILYNLHALKGASAGVGAKSIAVLALTAEQEMKASQKLSHESLADLRIAVEEVRHFIAELLDE